MKERKEKEVKIPIYARFIDNPCERTNRGEAVEHFSALYLKKKKNPSIIHYYYGMLHGTNVKRLVFRT